MASVYILYSHVLDRFYIGSCKDLSYRIGQHFNAVFLDSFTAKTDDWALYYSKDDLGYRQAKLIEQHIKKMKSKVYVQNLKAHPEMMEKLIIRYA